MKIRLRVDVCGQYWNGGAIIEIPEFFYQAFEPLKCCDEPIIAIATGDMLTGTESISKVIKVREDVAKILAEELTKMILFEMKKNDTHNGYKLANANKEE